MANRLELTINKWLREGVDTDAIAEKLLSRLWNAPDRDDMHTIAQFVLNAGLPHKLLEAYEDLLSQGKPIPWSGLIESLSKLKFQPTSELIQNALEGARTQGATEDLLLSFGWDKHSQEISLARRPIMEMRAQRLPRIIEELLKKLEFYRSQSLIEKERTTFDILWRLTPKSPQLSAWREDLDARFARYIIGKSSASQSLTAKSLAGQSEQATAKEWLSSLTTTLMSLMQRFPDRAFDLISVLLSMEYFEDAARAAQALPEGHESEWLKVDIWMRANQHLNALHLLDSIAQKRELAPEETFSLAYLKSQALWALGQKQNAINIMSHLVQIRPQFQQASHLLHVWQEASLQ